MVVVGPGPGLGLGLDLDLVVDEAALRAAFHRVFAGQPLFPRAAFYVSDFGCCDKPLRVVVTDVDHVDASVFPRGTVLNHDVGVLAPSTALTFAWSGVVGRAGAGRGGGFSKAGSAGINGEVFSAGFDCTRLGIGGLGKPVFEILRRGFLPRLFPQLLAVLGGAPRGAVLYGAPGCGKTLIARKLAEAFTAGGGVEPKVVNGPALLNKYVGQSEENMRAVFQDAANDLRDNGDGAKVHIIIFDEIDALCKKRGGGGGGGGGGGDAGAVGDSVLTQLLTMIDGVHALPNVFVFGLTNRFDLLDEALTRSGRLEIHVNIGLPDADGRVEILGIHLDKAKATGRLAEDVDIAHLGAATVNYTGAELAALVRNASSLAMVRACKGKDLLSPSALEDLRDIQLVGADFEAAMADFTPQFGTGGGGSGGDDLCMEDLVLVQGVSPRFATYLADLGDAVRAARAARGRTVLLVDGSPGCGKSAVVGAVLKSLDPPIANCRVLAAGTCFQAGMDERRKAHTVGALFADSAMTDEAVVVVENVETIVEWTGVGPRFSNTVLQALVGALSSPVRPGTTCIVVLTTREVWVVNDLGLDDLVDLAFTHPDVDTCQGAEEVLAALGCPDGVRHLAATCVTGVVSYKRLQRLAQLLCAVEFKPDDVLRPHILRYCKIAGIATAHV